MNMPKISVVMPIYNVEKYLAQSLESLLNQTYRELEIIAMDDGSTDSSYQILQTYAAKDARIQMHHWDNVGTSETMRRGIEYATGAYLAFLDSDDWAEPQFIETLYQALLQNNADISMGSYAVFDDKTGKTFINDKSWVKEMLDRNDGKLFPGAEPVLFDDTLLWNKMFPMKFFRGLPIQMPGDFATAADVLMAWEAMLSSKKTVVTPAVLVHYRTGRAGQHTGAKDDRFFACFDVFKYLFRFTDQDPRFKTLEPYFLHLQISRYLWGYERIPSSSHKAYFDQVCKAFQQRGYTKDSLIAYSSVEGKPLPEKFRAMILRVLHPMTLKAVVKERMVLWDLIIFTRKLMNTLLTIAVSAFIKGRPHEL